ncbi:MAG: GNAT family N-acetyltransferase [Paludibacteraceae bacterium]|nr:GNAT family N-acetyltransferase [Paludibacteraceae bacterium]
MIRILTYNEIDRAQWQALVEQSPTATWFQTPEAYQFYMSVPSELSTFVYAIQLDDNLKALVCGYVTREHSPVKQFFTRRAIIVGGPLIANDATDDQLQWLLQEVKERLHSEAIYIEIRNLHYYSPWKHAFEQAGFAYQPHLNIQVACNAQHQMSEQRIRQVKKALKNGVEIYQAQSEADIKAWYQILQQLYRKKVRTPLWSEDFFLQFYRDGVGKYLLVKHEGKIIGGMMCPILEGKTIYEWYVCGLDEDFRECYPSVVATYAAIEYAKEHGLPIFDFMGAGKPDIPYGVRDFKMEFGGEIVEHGRYLHVNKPLLYRIGKWGVNLLKHSRW